MSAARTSNGSGHHSPRPASSGTGTTRGRSVSTEGAVVREVRGLGVSRSVLGRLSCRRLGACRAGRGSPARSSTPRRRGGLHHLDGLVAVHVAAQGKSTNRIQERQLNRLCFCRYPIIFLPLNFMVTTGLFKANLLGPPFCRCRINGFLVLVPLAGSFNNPLIALYGTLRSQSRACRLVPNETPAPSSHLVLGTGWSRRQPPWCPSVSAASLLAVRAPPWRLAHPVASQLGSRPAPCHQ